MDNEIALIINAGIMAGATFLVFIFSVIKSSLDRKKQDKKEFFYTLYPKRLALYEDVCKWVDDIASKNIHKDYEVLTNKDENREFYAIFISLLALKVRCLMYGSIELTKILDDIIDFMNMEKQKDMNVDNNFSSFVSTMGYNFNKIFDYINSISFPPFIDDFIKPFEKQNKKLKKKKEMQQKSL